MASATEYPVRSATVSRKTKETDIQLALCIDGGSLTSLLSSSQSNGNSSSSNNTSPPSNKHAYQVSGSQHIDISTGIGFLDHMLHALSKHAGWSLYIRCAGDLIIDDHHTTEDVFLALGSAFNACLKSHPTASLGLYRFGSFYAPLDEALSRSVVDLSNRPCAVVDLGFKREKIGELSTEMITHGFQSFAVEARITLHVTCLYGDNDHHRAESAFKACAGALRSACARRTGTGEGELGSTKGVLY